MGKEKTKAKGGFEECYVDLIDQINTLILVSTQLRLQRHRPPTVVECNNICPAIRRKRRRPGTRSTEQSRPHRMQSSGAPPSLFETD